MSKILIVEDDENLLDMMSRYLRHEHYIVETSSNGKDAYALVNTYKYDILVLDWNIPGMTGVEICSKLRSNGNTVPILMLTGQSALDKKIAGFRAGTDDYLTKPFDIEELTVRLEALLRRSMQSSTTKLKVGPLELDPDKFKVSKDGQDVHLTAMEFSLLQFFMKNPDKVYSCEALLDRVWNADSDAHIETVRTCIKRLRQKLSSKDELIQNVHGVGYKLSADGSDSSES